MVSLEHAIMKYNNHEITEEEFIQLIDKIREGVKSVDYVLYMLINNDNKDTDLMNYYYRVKDLNDFYGLFNISYFRDMEGK